MKSEVRSLKFKIPVQNGCQKTQSICHNKNNPTKFKMPATKTLKNLAQVLLLLEKSQFPSSLFYNTFYNSIDNKRLIIRK